MLDAQTTAQLKANIHDLTKAIDDYRALRRQLQKDAAKAFAADDYAEDARLKALGVDMDTAIAGLVVHRQKLVDRLLA